MKKSRNLVRKLMIPLLAVSLLTGCQKSDNGGNGGQESQEVINQNRANEVIEAINALGDNPSEEAVANVRTMYDNLLNTQKRLVTNYDVLVAHENKIAASKVVALINALNNSSTKAQVDEVYEAYMELTEEQQALVNNYDKLEEQMHRLVIEEAIKDVVEALKSLNDSSSEEDVLSLRTAFEALSEEYKAYISQELKDKLNNLLNKYREEHVSSLESAINALEPASSSFESCLKLNAKLEDIKADGWFNDVSNEAKEKVIDLEESTSKYTKVTDFSNEELSDRKDFIGYTVASTFALQKDENYGDVYSIENTSYNACFGFANQADISSFDSLLFMLYNPNSTTDSINVWNQNWVNVVTLENVSAGWFAAEINLSQLSANYLTDFNIVLELNRVTSPWKISNAYGYVDSTNVTKVINQIDALTLDIYSSEEINAINAARTAYESLSRGGKKLVTNLSKLTEYETNVFNHHVNTVKDAIDALTYSSHSDEEETAISKARELYNALTDSEKLAVSNYSKLEELETAVAEYHHDESVAIYQEKLNSLVALDLLSSYIDVMALAKSISELDKEPESIRTDSTLDYTKYNAAVESLDLFHVLDDGSLTLCRWDYPISMVGQALTKVDDETYGNVRVLSTPDAGEYSLSIPKLTNLSIYENIVLTVYCPVSGGHISVHGQLWAGVSVDLQQGWNEVKVPVSMFNSTYPTDAIGIVVNKAVGDWKFGSIFGVEATDPDIIYDGKTRFAGWDYGPVTTTTALDEIEGVVQIYESATDGEHSFLIPVNSKMNNYTSLKFKVFSPQAGAHVEIHGTSWAGVSKDLTQGWNEITVPVSLVGQGTGYPNNGLGVVIRGAVGTFKISAIKGVN